MTELPPDAPRPEPIGEKPEAYCVRQPRYEQYVVVDLVKHVDAT